MEPALKTRLIGAAVLVAVAVIVVPMFFPGQGPEPDHGKTVSLALPVSPDQELTTRTMSVAPPATSAPATPAPAATSGSGQLATVNVTSRVPQDVHPENDTVPSSPPTAANAGQAARTPPASPSARPEPAPSRPQPKPSTPARPVASNPGEAAHGDFEVNLGAYADSHNAGELVRRVRKLGYSARTDKLTASGKPVTRVSAGPFATRAAAEAARLRLKSAIPSAPAKLVAATRDQTGDAPASALPAHRAGGWAVQVGAFSSKSDAQAEAAKLRAAGFAGFVDDVQSHGRTLWRVRAGPRTQRADAEKLRDQIKSRMGQSGVVVTVP